MKSSESEMILAMFSCKYLYENSSQMLQSETNTHQRHGIAMFFLESMKILVFSFHESKKIIQVINDQK
jgi:hypothetical protein